MALTKVSSSLVSDNAITTGKLVDGGVHSADIADVAVTSAKIANNAILTQHIDDAQVTTDQLGADAVTAAKIADDAISEEHLDITVITSLTAVTAATGDLLMVADVSDSNNLKKIPVSSILAGTHTGGSSGTHTGPVNSTGAITLGASALTLNGSLGTWSVNSEGARMNFGRGSANYINAVHESGFLVFQTSNGETALTLTSSQQANFTGTVTVAQNILSTSGSPLVLSAADGGSNIELYANGTAFIDATTTSFRGTNGSGTGNISAGNIAVSGTVDGVDIQTLNTTAGAALPKAGGTMTGVLSITKAGPSTLLIESTSANGNNVYLALKSPDTEWRLTTNRGDQISGNQGDLFFRENTAGVNALTIQTNTGNVGIGTTSPNTMLHVDAAASPSPTYPTLGTASGVLGLSINELHGMYLGADGSSGNGWIQAMREDGTGTAYNLSLQPSGGNVGIGETNPSQKLQVTGKIKVSDDIILAQTNGRIDYDNGVSSGALRFFSTSGNAERMRIASSGNVGIGTTNPAQNFVVAAATNGIGIELVPGTLNYIQAYNRGTSDYSDLKIDAQTIQFGVDNGTEAARFTADRVLQINATKNYGSGATYPSYTALGGHIHGYVNGSGTTYPRYLDIASIGQGDGNKGGEIRFLTSPNGSTTGVERVRINQAGNVGIGVTVPTSKLTLPLEEEANFKIKFQAASGTGHAGLSTVDQSGAGLYIGANSYVNASGVPVYGRSDYPSSGIYFDGWNADVMRFYTGASGNPTEKMNINNTGQILANSLGVSTPTFAFINDPNTGMTRPTTDTLQFVTGGAERARIDTVKFTHFSNSGSYHQTIGFLPSSGSRYKHVKTNVYKNNKMISFYLKGQLYSGQIINSHMCLYTYASQSTVHSVGIVNHNPSNFGFITPYYSSDSYLVLVIDQGSARSYTGFFLESTSGGSHQFDASIVAQTTTTSSTGAY